MDRSPRRQAIAPGSFAPAGEQGACARARRRYTECSEAAGLSQDGAAPEIASATTVGQRKG